MVKRICPNCGQTNFSDAGDKPWKCKNCNTDLGPELNMNIGERPKSASGFPVVGQVLPNGYTVLANFKNKFVLAINKNCGNSEQYATWHLDQDGDTYYGSYFRSREKTERHFASLCFDWFDNDVDLATDAFNKFKWGQNPYFSMGYDNDRNEILLCEHALMRIIEMANPAQLPRKIRLVSQDELMAHKGIKKLAREPQHEIPKEVQLDNSEKSGESKLLEYSGNPGTIKEVFNTLKNAP